MTDAETAHQDYDEFQDWVQIGRDLSYAAMIAGTVDRTENATACVVAIAQGVAEMVSMLCDDEKAGKDLLRTLAMPDAATARAVKLKRLAETMTDRINADLTPLSDFTKSPFDAPRRMHVAGRVITAMIPDGDVFALFHGPMDGEVMSQDRLQVLSSCENGAWG